MAIVALRTTDLSAATDQDLIDEMAELKEAMESPRARADFGINESDFDTRVKAVAAERASRIGVPAQEMPV